MGLQEMERKRGGGVMGVPFQEPRRWWGGVKALSGKVCVMASRVNNCVSSKYLLILPRTISYLSL